MEHFVVSLTVALFVSCFANFADGHFSIDCTFHFYIISLVSSSFIFTLEKLSQFFFDENLSECSKNAILRF